MDEQPSLLDYLRALIDPRLPRIPWPEEEFDFEESSGAGAAQENAPQEPPAIVEDYGRGKETPSPLPREGVKAGQVVEAPLAIGSETPETEPPGPFPWRSMAALFLALFAQGALEPPDRSLNMGVSLYLAAFAAVAWAFWSGELLLAALPRVSFRIDSLDFRRGAVWSAVPVIALAFVLLSGNMFTWLNVTVWLSAILLLVWGLAPGRIRFDPVVQRLKAWYQGGFRIVISRWALVVVAGVALVLFFRFYHLTGVPSQMFSDHAEKLQDVQDVLNGETHIFFPRNTGREFVQMYITAFTARYLGYGLTFMALKMGTALAGLLTFPYIYLLGVELANRRVGLLAMVLAGISYWLNVITRVALRFSLYPLFAAPVLYHIVRGLRRGSRSDFIWAGVFLGLGLHGYSPFRFMPVFVVVLIALYVIHAGTGQKRGQALWHLAIVVALSFVVFLPLLRFMSEGEANRSIVLYRSLTRIGTVEQPYPGSPWAIFADNLWRAMTMFAWENGGTWVHSVVFRPALDVVSAALFYLGYITLIVRYVRKRKWEDGALLLAVPFLLLPSVMSLAFPSENPSLNRTSGAIIPVFLIAALLLDGIMETLRGWGGKRWGALAAWSVAGFLLFWSSVSNYDLVFRQYGESFTRSAWNTTELGQVIRGFADSIGDEDSAWVIPYPYWVDTRLVGINAGVYIRDYALPREGIADTISVPGPKLFIFNLQDEETRAELERVYPDGIMQLYVSATPDKDFFVFFTPGGP